MQKTTTFLLALLLLLVSCSYPLPHEMPDLDMDVDDLELNTYVQLKAPKECNAYKSGKSVCLEVTNISNNMYSFNIKQDILIYKYENRNWEKVSDSMINIGKMDFVLDPLKNPPSNKAIVSVLPEIENGTSTLLRIFVIVHEQTIEKQSISKGAYTDLILEP